MLGSDIAYSAPQLGDLSLGSEPEPAHLPISNINEREAILARWGEVILNHGFGASFNHSIGRYGCPFV